MVEMAMAKLFLAVWQVTPVKFFLELPKLVVRAVLVATKASMGALMKN